jgi:hypothetical protein
MRAKLLAERARLHAVVRQLEPVSSRLSGREPSVVELVAAGGFLQNVYHGLENCMSRLARDIEHSVPTGPDADPPRASAECPANRRHEFPKKGR